MTTSTRIIKGPTPNGGVETRIYLEGNQVTITEYDKDGNLICETTAQLSPEEPQK